MKRIILFFAMLLSITAFAQKPQIDTVLAMDITWFNGKTPEQIIARFGTPKEMDLTASNYPADYTLIYEDFIVQLFESPEGSRCGHLDCFSTSSPYFSVLSDIFPGGIHVGGKISDLRDFDFATYANINRGNAKHNLTATNYKCGYGEYPEHYTIYSEDSKSILIDAENGVIMSWVIFYNDIAEYKPETNEVTIPMVAQ
jgi:hypothetical protein